MKSKLTIKTDCSYVTTIIIGGIGVTENNGIHRPNILFKNIPTTFEMINKLDKAESPEISTNPTGTSFVWLPQKPLPKYKYMYEKIWCSRPPYFSGLKYVNGLESAFLLMMDYYFTPSLAKYYTSPGQPISIFTLELSNDYVFMLGQIGISGQFEGLMIKTSSLGDIIKAISYGTGTNFTSSLLLNNNIYAVRPLVKLDLDGNVVFAKDVSNDTMMYLTTYFGNIYVLGFTSSLGAGGYDLVLTAFDVNGNLLWAKTYGGTGDDTPLLIYALSDGILIVARTSSFGLTNALLLIKTDYNGNIIWAKAYSGVDQSYSQFASVAITQDDIIVGAKGILLGLNGGWARLIPGSVTHMHQDHDGHLITVTVSSFSELFRLAPDAHCLPSYEPNIVDVTGNIQITDITSSVTVTDLTGNITTTDITSSIQEAEYEVNMYEPNLQLTPYEKEIMIDLTQITGEIP